MENYSLTCYNENLPITKSRINEGTSHMMKVFERVVRRCLGTYPEARKLLPEDQHGFRMQRSTFTQLFNHYDSVLDKTERK